MGFVLYGSRFCMVIVRIVRAELGKTRVREGLDLHCCCLGVVLYHDCKDCSVFSHGLPILAAPEEPMCPNKTPKGRSTRLWRAMGG